MDPRTVTPADVARSSAAARPRPPAAAAADVPARPYERQAWEQAIRFSELKSDARLVAMMLAHYARPTGTVSGDVLIAGRLAKACGLRPDDRVRGALSLLERRGYLTRQPAQRTPPGHAPRPVALTLPPRYQPPNTGGAPE